MKKKKKSDISTSLGESEDSDSESKEQKVLSRSRYKYNEVRDVTKKLPTLRTTPNQLFVKEPQIKKVGNQHFQKTIYNPEGISPTMREGHGDVIRILDSNVSGTTTSTNMPSKPTTKTSKKTTKQQTLEPLKQVKFQTLISSVRDFLAKHSASLENEKASRILGAPCFTRLLGYLKLKDPNIFSSKMLRGLLSHDRGRTFAVILSTLAGLGYDVQWMVLNSKFFGVPQNRERVFIVGSTGETGRPEILPFKESDGKAEKTFGEEALITNASEREFGWKKISGALASRDYKEPKIVMTQKSDSEIARVYSTEGISPTLHLKTGGWQEPKIMATQFLGSQGVTIRVREGIKIRRLTPIECERLQGFPDNWTKWGINEKGEDVLISDTQRYKMMGNAVTTNVITAITERLISVT